MRVGRRNAQTFRSWPRSVVAGSVHPLAPLLDGLDHLAGGFRVQDPAKRLRSLPGIPFGVREARLWTNSAARVCSSGESRSRSCRICSLIVGLTIGTSSASLDFSSIGSVQGDRAGTPELVHLAGKPRPGQSEAA